MADGIIRIETENRYIDAPVKGYDDIEEGDFVVLKVTDNGIGISEEDINRIFEPFYTKKVMGRSGTGWAWRWSGEPSRITAGSLTSKVSRRKAPR
jgi:hypothetical protein